MQEIKKERTISPAAKIILSVLILSCAVYLINQQHKTRIVQEKLRNEINEVSDDIREFQKSNKEIKNELDLISEIEEIGRTAATTDVLFTNYYTGDGSSGTTTASGLSTNDFTVNDLGMYLYDHKVVLATAHTSLGNVRAGFRTHQLYDTVVFELNNVIYTGIVLDKCGTCTWGNSFEDKQRYDIFTTHSVIGKQPGMVIERND
ncbi:hypothetical protein G7059_08065 [Erysipelothrix sp. HDW6A]|uniref:hypothetical protein n=1 Tax=Erysipelothrix sp. HDW6A TaxID=2714928 RepID=UPI001409DF88|nr:hypothetical protein [Erysipelothrix sp. HDW6A]QIK57797.1 hypothetical protein G7059_08065 [Erysipelothrix sp. HDW6A]